MRPAACPSSMCAASERSLRKRAPRFRRSRRNAQRPIINGGELRAKKRSAQAAYDAALAGYQQTVLQALQQVADTLTALQNDARELEARDVAAQEAQASYDIAHAQYAAGGVSQFGLLD